MTDFVLIEGGIAQDHGDDVYVFNVDFLDGETSIDRQEVEWMLEDMEMFPRLQHTRERVQAFYERTWPDCPKCGEPYDEQMDGSWNMDGSDACFACYHNARRGGWVGESLV